MKRFSAAVVMLIALGFGALNAQIGGLSASKLAVINTETVPRFTIEFEPSFFFGYSSRYWDHAGQSKSLFKNTDSLQVNSEMDFRFTYGLTEHWEAGFTLPSDVAFINVGSKYRFLEKEKYSLAILNGINLPLGNHVYHITNRRHSRNEYDANLLLGLATTYQFNKKFSVDLNSVFQGHLNRGFSHVAEHADVFFNTDFGYYFIEGLQGIIGFYFSRTRDGLYSGNAKKLTINPGFTVEKARHFIAVMNFPIDVWGRNSESRAGVGFALTIWIN